MTIRDFNLESLQANVNKIYTNERFGGEYAS